MTHNPEVFSAFLERQAEIFKQAGKIELLSMYDHQDAMGNKDYTPDYTPQEIESFTETVAPHGDKVEAISLSFNPALDDTGAAALAGLVRACPNARSLQLSSTSLTADALPTLSAALQDCPNIYNLTMDKALIGGRGAGQKILDLINANPHITNLDISGNPLTADDVATLAAGLADNRSLHTLHLGNTCAEPAAQDALIDMMGKNTYLTTFTYDYEGMGEAQAERFAQAIRRSENPNYSYVRLHKRSADFAVDLTARSSEGLTHFQQAMAAQPDCSQQSYAALANTERHLGYLTYIGRVPGYEPVLEGAQAYRAFADTLPDIDCSTPVTVHDLLQPNDNGFAPLDNPRLWHKEEAVFSALEASGEELTPDNLNRRSDKGTSLLESALLGGRTGRVLGLLNDRGIRLDEKLLLQANGESTPLFDAIIEKGDGAKLFTAQNWRGGSSNGLDKAMEKLPDEQRDAITNRFQLRHAVQQNEATVSRGR